MKLRSRNTAVIAAIFLLLGAVVALVVGLACRDDRCSSSSSTVTSNLRASVTAQPQPLPTLFPTSSPMPTPSPMSGDPGDGTTQLPQPTPLTTPAPSVFGADPTETIPPTEGPTATPPLSPFPTPLPPPPPPLSDDLVNVTRMQPATDSFARFGGSVAMDRDFLVVGADGEGDAGRAYVYQRGGDESSSSSSWMLVQTLVPQDGRGGDGFGQSVAIHGRHLVVGAPYCDPEDYELYYSSSAGCAYVYQEQDEGIWQLEVKLESSMVDGAQSEQFGYSVAIYGDALVISAPKWGDSAKEGGAYVYRRQTSGEWQKQQTLQRLGYPENAMFGWEVSMDAQRIVVGCFGTLDDGGSAYIFARQPTSNRYQLEQKLVPNEPEATGFGRGVAIDGLTVVIGRPERGGFNANTGKHYGGAAYVFTLTNTSASDPWYETQILRQVTIGNDYFGEAVAVRGPNIVVGAPNGEPDDTCFLAPEWNNSTFCLGNLGIAYTYTRLSDDEPTWTQLQEIYEEVNFDAGKDFGMALDIHNGTVAIGVRKAGQGARGRVVVFDSRPAE